MFRRFIDKFSSTLYVQIWENRIRVVDIKTNVVFDEKPQLQVEQGKNGAQIVTAFGNKAYVNPLNPFSHPRALLNDFFVAERLLKEIINKLGDNKRLAPAPRLIIHPMEKTEGGLTMIEIRAFREMALGAGARDVVIHQGHEPLVNSAICFQELAKQEQELAIASIN
ncbi:rod shape-determining protein [uncultured Shewanella sp.]|uniref:rod shape-determining protein n=1 Tax=uncultured Shewanella sp. TaxID=173975 RepID=UPI0026340EB0|nr:rod shape-determining protein [uncultured Shewanella sp.]